MKLKNYFFIMLVGMLWSTGAMAGTVNINSTDLAELVDSNYGIGPRLAQAIVNYRSQYGDFDSIDDLMGVSGIGIAIINANQGVIVVKDVPLQTQVDDSSD
jgi:competence protein ComEA